MSTYMPKPGEVTANWHVVDATDQVLGRLASRVSLIIQGKHKATFTPHVETGDFVVIINADKVRVTGQKAEVLEYQTYSRYPGGQKRKSMREVMEKSSTRVIEHAVRGMLPHNRLGREQFRSLFVYEGAEHPHAAQQPKAVDLTNL